MKTMLSDISQGDYDKTDPVFRLIFHDHPRRFAKICLPGVLPPRVLCWQSDSIEPIIVCNEPASAVWIGIDQRIACVSSKGSVLFSAGLSTPLLQIKLFDKCVLVVCEIDILVIDPDFSLLQAIHMREVIDSVDLIEDKLIVSLIDNESETIPI